MHCMIHEFSSSQEDQKSRHQEVGRVWKEHRTGHQRHGCPRWSAEHRLALLGCADLPPTLKWTEQLPSSPLCESEHGKVLSVSEQGTKIKVITAFYYGVLNAGK